jgi:hypothetical protein
MRSVTGLWSVSLAALLSLLAPAHAQACSCLEQSAADALREAQAVFEGRVLAVTRDAERPELWVVQLAAVRSWKGVASETVMLTTPQDSAGCGYPFVKDESYLVYAQAGSGGLHASLCSRTQPIAQAEADLAVLGMGVVPFSPRQPNLSPADKVTLEPSKAGCAGCNVGARNETSAAAVAAALAVAGIVLVRARRARRR